MVIFSNLKIWDKEKRDFQIQNIEVNYDSSIFRLEDNTINCRDFLGIPFGVDLHVNFREPGYENKEDMLSGAEAALFGGILTVVDMPNNKPLADSIEAIKNKRNLSKKQEIVEILIAAAITENNYNEVASLEPFCDAYKIYMSEYLGELKISEESILSALEKLEDIGTSKPIIFHAEDSTTLSNMERELSNYKRRPPEAEAIAIQKILQWAKDYSSLKFHITHISSSLSLKLLELANSSNLTTDTCPRYLFFNQNSELDEKLKIVTPPLRKESDNNSLIKGLSTGIIDMISSDHSPHTLEEKMKENLSGMPGVQELLPALITLIHSGELEWERAIEAYHNFPLKLLNIGEKPIEENFLIIDPYTPFLVDENWIQSKAKWSPFQNKMMYGSIKYIVKDSQLLLKVED